MSEKQTTADSWDGILINYLKADDLENEEDRFVCIGLNVNAKDVELELERQQIKYIFSLNTTNKLFLKDNGIKAPKQVIGKVLTLKKVLATNPTTRKEVPSLRIAKIETA